MHTNLGFRYQNEALYFYAVLGASFVDYVLLGLVYWRTLTVVRKDRKWKTNLAESIGRCSAVAIVALVSMMTGWKILYVRRLLLNVSWTGSPK